MNNHDLCCKTLTDTTGLIEKIAKNGRKYASGTCSKCGKGKSSFLNNKIEGGCIPCGGSSIVKNGGEFDSQSFLSKLPGVPWSKYPSVGRLLYGKK